MPVRNKRLSRGWQVIALLYFALIRVECTLAAPSEQPRVKIGYITDLTGMGAFFGIQSQRGAQLAEEEFAEQSLEIIFEDIAGKPASAVTAATKLLMQDRVDAIICDLTPPCTAIAPLVHDEKKILIYHSPSTSIAAKFGQSFRNFIDYREACRRIAQHWKQQGFSDIGSLNGNFEFGDRCFEGVEDVFPKHYAYRNNPGDDLRSAVLAFKERKLQHIVFTGFEPDFLSWLKLSRAQGAVITPGFIELLITESLWKQLGELPFSGLMAGFEEAPAEFRSRLEKRFPQVQQVNMQGAAISYVAVFALFEAFDACPGKQLDCLIRKLKQPKSWPILGFRGWREGEPAYPVKLKSIEGRRISLLPD